MSLFAQTTLNPELPPRPLSLQEALGLAVQHNFDVEIGRYNPEIARYNLAGAYSYYDPAFTGAAEHRVRVREGTSFNPATGLPFPGSESKSDTLSAGLGGYLPTGLRYDVSGSSVHNYGSQGFTAFDNYETDVGISLRQPLLRNFWIDANRLQIKVAKKDLIISEYAFAQLLMDTVNRTQQGYYELIAARDEIVSREKALEVAQRFASETRRRVELGTLAPLEEKNAEAEAAAARANLISARQNAALRENDLKDLITDNYELWHASTVTPSERLLAVPETFDVGASWLNGVTYRPDYLALKEQMERQGYWVKYYRNQMLPSVDLVGTYGRVGIENANPSRLLTNTISVPGPDIQQQVFVPGHDASFSGTLDDIREERNPRYSYGIQVTVPLTFRRERNELKTAKAQFEQDELRFRQKRQDIMIAIDNAINVARASLERVDATRQTVAAKEAAVDAEQKKEQAGRSTPFSVLLLQRDLTDARSAAIRALADYNKALAELRFAEGTILDRNRITVEFR